MSSVKTRTIIQSALILAMRVSILACKLGLTVFVGRFIDLSALGLLGLCTGIVAVGPSLTGLGMVHVIMRDAVTLPLPKLTDHLRHYWCFVVFFYVQALFVAISASMFFGWSGLWALVIAVTLLEHIGNDVFQLLSNLQKPLQANASAFVRGAGWILLYIPLAIWNPALRSLPALLSFWLAGGLIALALFFWASRSWPWKPTPRTLIRFAWFIPAIKRGSIIYVSDLSFVASQYLDRYLVTLFLGLDMAGVYFLYWSAANAMSTFVSIGVLQVQRPLLIQAHVQGGDVAHQKLVLPFLGATIMSTAVLGGLVGVAFYLVLPYLKQTAASELLLAFWLIMAGMALRNVADFGAMLLFTAHRDRIMTLSNVAAVIGLVIFQSALLPWLGLNGAGAAMILTFGAITLWRAVIVYGTGPQKRSSPHSPEPDRQRTGNIMPEIATGVGSRSCPR